MLNITVWLCICENKIAVQIGRYIVTMMSTGVILAIGFQMSGWYIFYFPILECVYENICTYSQVSDNSVNKFYTNIQSYLTKMPHIICDVDFLEIL
jgi:hypothetical protein